MDVTDSPAWRAGVDRADETVRAAIGDLEGHLARLLRARIPDEPAIGFTRWALERYREALPS